MVEFPTTAWTIVRSAITMGGSVNTEAMDKLCVLYARPLRTLIGSICWSNQEADDLAQDFILEISQGKYLSNVNPDDGRLRHYLLQCGRNFLRNAWRVQHAQKRGGNASFVSIDENPEAEWLASVPPDAAQAFDREWARTIIQRALTVLRKENVQRGKSENLTDCLIKGLGWSSPKHSSIELARECDMSEGAFRTAVHRFKRQFGEQLREEIRETVGTEEEAAEELKYLVRVFSDSKENTLGL